VRHLERAGFVVMNLQSAIHSARGRIEGSARPAVLRVRS
jgi:hypothetical protein